MFKEALLATLLLAGLLSVILGLVWPVLFPDIEMPSLLYAAIPSIVFADVAGTAIRFKRVIKWEVIARCVFEPWTFLVMAITLFGLGFDDTALLVAYSLSLVAAAAGILIGCYFAFDMKKFVFSPVKVGNFLKISRKSFPVGVTDVGIMMFRRFDILVLSVFTGHEATGIYYMAQQIVTVPHKIHQLFEPMMSPVLAKLHHDSGKEAISDTLKRVCRWVFSLQLALTVPFAIFGTYILGIFGNEFEAGVFVLAFLLVAELMDGSFALTETPLVFATPKIPPILIMSTLAIEFVMIALLSSAFGAVGAAIGFAVAMLFLAVARLYVLDKYYDIALLDRAFLWPAGFALVIGGTLLPVSFYIQPGQHYLAATAVFTAIGAFLMLLKTLGLTKSDKLLLQKLRSS